MVLMFLARGRCAWIRWEQDAVLWLLRGWRIEGGDRDELRSRSCIRHEP